MISDATLRRVLPPSTVALTGDLVRALLWGAVVVVWISFLRVYARMWWLTLGDPSHSDFTIFYYTARLVADGLPMYGASPARYGIEWEGSHLGNLNPPHFQLLTQPLAWLSYEQAFVVWTVASLLALAASVLVIAGAHSIELTWRRFFVWGAFAVSCAGFTTVAITSELTFLLMVPFSLALRSAIRGQWGLAGFWLGLCASIKLFLLLFIPWLVLHRRWRALGGVVMACLVAMFAGAALYGLQAYVQWSGSLGQVGWEWLHMNASWPGFLARALRGDHTMTPVWQAPQLVKPLSLAGSVLLCVATIALVRPGGDRGSNDVSVAFLVLLTGAILASPLGWVYYAPLLLGPAVGVLWTGAWRRIPVRGLVPLGVVLFGLYVPPEQAASGQPSRMATVLLASSYFWGTLGLWAGGAALSAPPPERR